MVADADDSIHAGGSWCVNVWVVICNDALTWQVMASDGETCCQIVANTGRWILTCHFIAILEYDNSMVSLLIINNGCWSPIG